MSAFFTGEMITTYVFINIKTPNLASVKKRFRLDQIIYLIIYLILTNIIMEEHIPNLIVIELFFLNQS